MPVRSGWSLWHDRGSWRQRLVLLASPRQPERREPLGVQPTERRRVLTIEGRSVERPAAEVLITLEGRTLHTVCLFGEGGDLDVLGAYTLEGFGSAVDPVQRRLVPSILYGA